MQRRFTIRGGHLHELVYDTDGMIGTLLGIRSEREVNAASELLFAHPMRRVPYYQVGDFILRSELSYQDAAARFREFHRPERDEFPWGDLFREVLDINTVVLTKRIMAIQGDGSSGVVVLKNYFKISDQELIELHDHSGNTLERQAIPALDDAAHWYELRYGGGQGALYFLEATAAVSTLPLGGAARQVSSRILTRLGRRVAARTARYLLRRGCRRLVRFLLARSLRAMAGFMLKMARDIGVKYVRACRLTDMQNEIRVAAGRHPTPMDTERILREVCASAVTENLIDVFADGLNEAIPEVDLTAAIGDQVKHAIGSYLAERMFRIAIAPMQEVARSAIAYTHDPGSGKSYAEGLTDHISTAVQERFSERMFADEFRSAVSAIGENPGLVLGH